MGQIPPAGEHERASERHAAGVVRIFGPEGSAVGAGLLVDSEHIVTCAHVAAVACGSCRRSQELPTGTIMVDFPAIRAAHEPLRAHVLQEGWRPISPDESGDVAVLELAEPLPVGAAPPPLLRPPDTVGRKVIAEGFPIGYTGAITSKNIVVADAGPAREWIQLELNGENGFAIEEGYSGAPLWDPVAGAVLGIALGTDASDRGAFMLATRTLAKAWPRLSDSIGWRLRFDPERDTHWEPSGRGVASNKEAGWLFTGREKVLRALVGWIERPDEQARVVWGQMGSGKSAVLSRLVTLSDREQLSVPSERPAAGTAPPCGAVDLAMVVADKSLDDVVASIARWLDVKAETARELVRALSRRADGRTPPLIVIDQLDAARNPADLIEHLLTPLTENRAARLMIGLKRRDDCPLARALARHARLLNLDEEYRDDEAMREYVRRVVLEPGGSAGQVERARARRVAAAITNAAGTSFVVARLSAMWQHIQPEIVERPLEDYPATVTEALDENLNALSEKLAGEELGEAPATEARRAELGRKLRALLTALAYARGPGLPLEGPSWPAIAAAIQPGPFASTDVRWLLDTQASFLLQRIDVDGELSYRLFHEALRACLREGVEESLVEAAIVERLSKLCDPLSAAPATAYVARNLPAHVAAADDWENLAARPYVLDRLEPRAVCAEALRAGLQLGSLPLAIAGVVRSTRLMTRSGAIDRAGLRQLGMARGSDRRAFNAEDAAAPIAGWTLRSAVVHHDAAHLTLDAPASVNATATFSGPEGLPVLVAGCSDGSVRLWSGATGEPFGDPLVAVQGDRRRVEGVWSLACCQTSSGVRIVLGMDRGTVRIWDPERGEESPSFDSRHVNGVRAIAVLDSPAGLRVITGGDEDELRVWSEAGERLHELSGGGTVLTLALEMVDGRAHLLCGGEEGRVRIWEDVAQRLAGGGDRSIEASRELIGPLDWVRGVCMFAISGELIVGASGDEHRLTLWRLPAREPVHRRQARQQRVVLGLAAYRDRGRPRIATCGADASIELWDGANASPIGEPLHGHRGDARAVTAYEFGGEPRILTGGGDCTVRIWNPANAKAAKPGVERRGRAVCVRALVSLDGVLVTGGPDGRLRTWGQADGEPVGDPCDARVGPIRVIAAGPHGGVAVGGDELVRFLDPLTGAELAAPLCGHTAPVRALLSGLTFEEEPVLASGSEDRSVRLWRVADGAEITAARSRHRGPVRALASVEVPGAGCCLAVVGVDRDIPLRPIGEHQTTGAPLRGHCDWPMAACRYSAPGVDVLVTGGDDGTVRSWNTLTRAPLSLRGRHDGPVRAVAALERAGQVRVASGGEDETVRVWDPHAPHGEQEVHLLRLGIPVNALSLLRDALLIGTDEGHLVVRLAEMAD